MKLRKPLLILMLCLSIISSILMLTACGKDNQPSASATDSSVSTSNSNSVTDSDSVSTSKSSQSSEVVSSNSQSNSDSVTDSNSISTSNSNSVTDSNSVSSSSSSSDSQSSESSSSGSGTTQPEKPKKDFEYTLNEDKQSYSVVGIGSVVDTEIVIPATYQDLPVTSIGEHAFFYCDSLTSITIPNSVTSIGYQAFIMCTKLTNITIPNSVTYIGNQAFYGCSNLKYNEYDNGLYLGNSTNPYLVLRRTKDNLVTSCVIADTTKVISDAFSGCTSLTSVTMPNSVTSIGSHAFYMCSSLTSIIIPDSVIYIDWSAFGGCSSLENITLPFVGGSIKSDNDTYQYPFGFIFGESEFTGGTATTQYYYKSSTNYTDSTTYYIPSSLKSVTITGGNILHGAFYNCSNLTSITIPNSATSIGDKAFGGCSKLTSMSIPEAVKSIGGYAFRGCNSLINITIGSGVTSIANDAFMGCYKLVEVYNLSSLNIKKGAITDYGRVGCNALDVYTDKTAVSKLATDNDGFIIHTDGESKTLISYTGNATEITIPNGITSICRYAFNYCHSLTSITIPNGTTSIGNNAFWECSSLENINVDSNNTTYSSLGGILYNKDKTEILCVPDAMTSVTIPEGVTSIGYRAFDDCSKLTSIIIPETITSIGDRAFEGCSSLESITISDSVISLGNGVFENCNNLKYNEYENGLYLGNNTNPYLVLVKVKDNSITNCVIANTTKFIQSLAFYNCNSLTNITIPKSVTSIGSNAFYMCSSLTINCEAESQPSGWYSNWNSTNCPVVWGYKG